MENKGKGRPSSLPSAVVSNRATAPASVDYCYDQVNPGPPFRTGGNFFLTHRVFHRNEPQGSVYIVGPKITDPQTLGFTPTAVESWHWTYKGGFGDPFLGAPPANPFIGFTPSGMTGGYHSKLNPDDLDSLGNRAWGKLRPDPAHAGLGQAIAEARDLPNMLRGSAKFFHRQWTNFTRFNPRARVRPKEVTDEFLNQNFGWLPFLGDVGDMYKLVTDFKAIEAKEIERNGKFRKRKFREEETVSKQLVYQSNSPSNGSYTTPSLFNFNRNLNLRDPEGLHNAGRPDHLSVHSEHIMEIWYEGKFRSYRPEFDRGLSSGYPALDTAQRALTMSGLRITPTLLYNITPWSWLIDWFAGVGDAVQRYQDMLSDTVAAEYFYLMRRIVGRYQYTVTKSTYSGFVTLNWSDGSETLRRLVGMNAFGFSGSPSGLSGRQLAILGALGVSNR